MRYLMLFAAFMLVVGCSKPATPKKSASQTSTTQKLPKMSPEKIQKKINDASKLIKSLPEGIDFMVKMNALDTLFTITQLNGTSIFGIPMDEFKQVSETLGFNPFNVKELATQGIDLKREIALFGANVKADLEKESLASIDLYLAIPVTKDNKIISLIESKIKAAGEEITLEKLKNGVTLLKGKKEKQRIFFIPKDGYLMIGTNPFSNPEPFITKLIAPKSTLDQQKGFQKLAAHFDTGSDVVIYLNMKGMLDRNIADIEQTIQKELGRQAPIFKKQLEMIQDYDQAIMTMNLSTPSLIFSAGVSMVPKSNILALMRAVTIDKNIILGMKETPVLLFSMGLNPEEYYKMISEMMASFMNIDEMIQKGNKALGIDIKKELIQNLSGSFSMGMFDGKSINMGNLNGIASIGVKDAKLATKTMNTLMEKVPETSKKSITVKDIVSYEITTPTVKIYMGIKGKNLIIALSKDYYEKALKAAPENGFTTTLKDQDLKKSLTKNNSSFFYLSIDEGLKVANSVNPQMMDRQVKIVEEVKKISYLLFDAHIQEDLFFSRIIVKTTYQKSFIEGLSNLIKVIGF